MGELLKVNFEDIGGGYETCDYKSVAANVIPSFATTVRAKAVWMMCSTLSSGVVNGAYIITNVNPTTGEASNANLYRYTTDGNHAAWGVGTVEMVITDNSVSLTKALSTAHPHVVSMIYTYN